MKNNTNKNEIAFEMRNISKYFLNGEIKANDKISFTGNYGEVIGLVGENGAGKSTLMSVLFGLYKPDNGEILVNNKKVNITSPLFANKLGIGMVPQHFKLVDNMTVIENIMLGVEKTKYGILDRKTIKTKIIEISKKYKLDIDPDAKIQSLPIAKKQKVEIAKMLFRDSNIVILDEPTSVLTPQEAEQMLEVVKMFKKAGKLVIFISHKLDEIISVSDKIVIMRKGQVTGEISKKGATPNKIAKLMVGESAEYKFTKGNKKLSSEIVIEVKGITKFNNQKKVLNNVSLEVYKGEILGLVGIDGNGQNELLKLLAGHGTQKSGKITNHLIEKKSKYTNGLGYIPADRQGDGVAMDLSVSNNMIFNRLSEYQLKLRNIKTPIINKKKEKSFTSGVIKKYNVHGAGNGKPIFRGLSGGNQQKAVTGREVENAKKLLIASNPTRGVDIGAIKTIYKHIINQAEKGTTVVFTSGELDEMLAVADRLLVFSKGEIIGEANPKIASKSNIGLMMVGQKNAKMKGVK